METGILRIVAFKDGTKWAAQCLEVDVCVQADDFETLKSRMSLALRLYREESINRTGVAFQGIGPAPQMFQDLWAKRDGLSHSFSVAA